MGMSGISKSQESRLCEDRAIFRHWSEDNGEGRQGEGLPRPADRGRLALSVDRRDLPEGPAWRARRHCRSDQWRNNGLLSVAVIIAVGVNTDGRREVLGMDTGTSEAEPIWTEFLRKLTRRGLRGVKLVISDAHECIKAAVTKVLCATWQRCRVHFMRNVLAHAGKSGRVRQCLSDHWRGPNPMYWPT